MSDVSPGARALATMTSRIDKARALFRAHTLCGHRASLTEGRMVWAIPGGERASSNELKSIGAFEQVSGPADEDVAQFTKEMAS